MTDEQYRDIEARTRKAASSHYIQKQDVDDIVQDIAVDVMTNDVPPNEYSTVISKHLGKFRQRRDRETDRLVRFI